MTPAVKALGELENICRCRRPAKHLNRITPLIEQVQNVNHRLVEQHRQRMERIDARIEESRQRLQEAHTSELQNSVLLPMQKSQKALSQPFDSGNSGGTTRDESAAQTDAEED